MPVMSKHPSETRLSVEPWACGDVEARAFRLRSLWQRHRAKPEGERDCRVSAQILPAWNSQRCSSIVRPGEYDLRHDRLLSRYLLPSAGP